MKFFAILETIMKNKDLKYTISAGNGMVIGSIFFQPATEFIYQTNIAQTALSVAQKFGGYCTISRHSYDFRCRFLF